ncbi:MAG: cobalt ECF transporter T component CbiQ [Thiolinea sp.]
MPQFLEHSMVSWRGQQLAHQHSLIDQFDPRARIMAMTLFALATVFSHNLLIPALALLLSITVALQANLDMQRTIRRVIAMDVFIVFMIIMLPFTTPGDALFHVFGFAASKQGFLQAIEIGLKTNAVVLMLLALLGTLEATTLGHALARLRVPEKLVHLMLFTVRYLEVIGREYKRMRKAMKARAFQPRSNWHTWRSIGYLVGMLLIHSLERSERIHAAMKCRGFNGRLYLLDHLEWRRCDNVLLIAALSFTFLAIVVGLSL